jgi:hypothetical protein
MPSEPQPRAANVEGSSLSGLLRKEWIVFSHRVPFFVFGVFILASLQTVRVGDAYLLVGVALAAALALYVPAVEWFEESNPMLHSLPVSRGGVVVARYVVAVLAGGVAGVVWGATGRLLLPLLDAGRETPAMWLTVEGMLTFFVLVGLFFALLLPLHFRLGLGRGFVAFLALSLGLMGVGYGTMSLATRSTRDGTLVLHAPGELVRVPLPALASDVGLAGTLTAVLVGMALLTGVSILLSRRWFARREF